MPVVIGTSGWQYAPWRRRFYPEGLRAADWLPYYAERFATVELNNAFYRLPEAASFAAWAAKTPADFVLSVKASRYLTHVKRLRDPAEPVHRLMERARAAGKKLGPVLLQLPENFKVDLGALEAVLAQFPKHTPVAFEPRHESWYTEATVEVLHRAGAALCLHDWHGRKVGRDWRSTHWGYVRLHGGAAAPPPSYGRRALTTWAERLAELYPAEAEVFVYFNNDSLGCALRDARRFAVAVARVGLEPTRVPSARDVRACGVEG
ncbi:MAG TPA: DUF72 domain-containing protein [Acidimicrobiales bacterium]|nr:DUF72 domain-containing protein [Acidimicrobiales bacterium]